MLELYACGVDVVLVIHLALGCDDEGASDAEMKERILLHLDFRAVKGSGQSAEAAPVGVQLNRTGMVQAVIGFARCFSESSEVEFLVTERHLWAFRRVEEDVWMVWTVATEPPAPAPDHQSLLGAMDQVWDAFTLLWGSVPRRFEAAGALEFHGQLQAKRRQLRKLRRAWEKARFDEAGDAGATTGAATGGAAGAEAGARRRSLEADADRLRAEVGAMAASSPIAACRSALAAFFAHLFVPGALPWGVVPQRRRSGAEAAMQRELMETVRRKSFGAPWKAVNIYGADRPASPAATRRASWRASFSGSSISGSSSGRGSGSGSAGGSPRASVSTSTSAATGEARSELDALLGDGAFGRCPSATLSPVANAPPASPSLSPFLFSADCGGVKRIGNDALALLGARRLADGLAEAFRNSGVSGAMVLYDGHVVHSTLPRATAAALYTYMASRDQVRAALHAAAAVSGALPESSRADGDDGGFLTVDGALVRIHKRDASLVSACRPAIAMADALRRGAGEAPLVPLYFGACLRSSIWFPRLHAGDAAHPTQLRLLVYQHGSAAVALAVAEPQLLKESVRDRGDPASPPPRPAAAPLPSPSPSPLALGGAAEPPPPAVVEEKPALAAGASHSADPSPSRSPSAETAAAAAETPKTAAAPRPASKDSDPGAAVLDLGSAAAMSCEELTKVLGALRKVPEGVVEDAMAAAREGMHAAHARSPGSAALRVEFYRLCFAYDRYRVLERLREERAAEERIAELRRQEQLENKKMRLMKQQRENELRRKFVEDPVAPAAAPAAPERKKKAAATATATAAAAAAGAGAAGPAAGGRDGRRVDYDRSIAQRRANVLCQRLQQYLQLQMPYFEELMRERVRSFSAPLERLNAQPSARSLSVPKHLPAWLLDCAHILRVDRREERFSSYNVHGTQRVGEGRLRPGDAAAQWPNGYSTAVGLEEDVVAALNDVHGKLGRGSASQEELIVRVASGWVVGRVEGKIEVLIFLDMKRERTRLSSVGQVLDAMQLIFRRE